MRVSAKRLGSRGEQRGKTQTRGGSLDKEKGASDSYGRAEAVFSDVEKKRIQQNAHRKREKKKGGEFPTPRENCKLKNAGDSLEGGETGGAPVERGRR